MYHEACEEMRDHREDFTRSYLAAVSERLVTLHRDVELAIVKLGGRKPLDRPDAFAGDVVLPTIDELLGVVPDFTRRELRKLGIYDEDAIVEVSGEEYRIY